MTRPFEGIRVFDITHVLAGPFAAYQLGLLGADVIKVEHPDDPDQSRSTGSDTGLNEAQMGTAFLTQGSNKRSLTLDLKTEPGREVLKRLVATAAEWEAFLQSRHVPAARVRTMAEAVADPQLATRGVIHRAADAPGIPGGYGVPVAPFLFAHGGPQVDSPPPGLGEQTGAILAELRYSTAEIANSRAKRAV